MEENTIVKGTVVEIKKRDAPWKDNEIGKRQMKMLELGYMADITIKIKDSKFRCHKNILGISSPNFAALFREQPKTLQLKNIDPNHFRFLLEIIYSGEATGLNDADNTLGVLRTSKNLQVYSAVSCCTVKLRDMIDATSVCQILDLALETNDSVLKEACVKVIREETDSVLISNSFIKCSIDALKLILSQEVVHAIIELDLFLACLRWSEKYKNPREALGSALGLIRFRVFSRSEFMCNVIQTRKLLTEEEGKTIFDYIIYRMDEIPKYFSHQTCKRKLFLRDDEVGAMQIGTGEQISLLISETCMTYMPHVDINKLPPLQFSVNAEMNLMGVEVWSMFASYTLIDTCMEDIVIILRNGDGKILSTTSFNGEMKSGSFFQIRFLRPVRIHADVIYSLQYINNVSNVLHLTFPYEKHTLKTTTNVEIQILDQVMSVIRDLIIAPNIPNEIEKKSIRDLIIAPNVPNEIEKKSTLIRNIKKYFTPAKYWQ